MLTDMTVIFHQNLMYATKQLEGKRMTYAILIYI